MIPVPADPTAKFEILSSPFSNAVIPTNSAVLSMTFQDWELRHLWKLSIRMTDSYGRTRDKTFHFRAVMPIGATLNPSYSNIYPTSEFFGVLVIFKFFEILGVYS